MSKFIQQRPRSQTALNDWIDELEDLERAAGDDLEVTIPRTTLAHIISLLKELRLGGRPGRGREAYLKEWSVHIKARRRIEKLITEERLSKDEAILKVVRELKQTVPFKDRSAKALKDWLSRSRPRRYR
jgi:hypothetical protein